MSRGQQISGGSSVTGWNPDLGDHGERDGTQEEYYSNDDPTPFPTDKFPPDFVVHLHQRSDVDSAWSSQHHTLGPRANQASPGNHTHDGGTSKNISAWTPWSGAATSWTASTNPSIGSGHIEGKYSKIGTLVTYRFSLVAASDTNFGSGGWLFGLPFPAVLPASPIPAGAPSIGSCHGFQGGTSNYAGVAIFSDQSHISLVSHNLANSWQSTTPVTWAANSNNYWGFEITYESVN